MKTSLKVACAIFLICSIPFSAFSQECKFVKDTKGEINNVIMINGTPHMFFTIDRSKEILKLAEKGKTSSELIELNKRKVAVLEGMIISKDHQIEFLMKMNQTHQSFIDKNLVREKGWYEKNSTHFIFGVVFASLAYGYWNFSRRGE